MCTVTYAHLTVKKGDEMRFLHSNCYTFNILLCIMHLTIVRDYCTYCIFMITKMYILHRYNGENAVGEFRLRNGWDGSVSVIR